MKIRPVGAELFHADGRTDMAKILVAFLNFASASNMLRQVGCIFYSVLLTLIFLLVNWR